MSLEGRPNARAGAHGAGRQAAYMERQTSKGSTMQQFGRIIRVERATGAIETFVVFEPNKAKAVATIRAAVAGDLGKVEPIGRASAAMLAELGLKATQYVRA